MKARATQAVYRITSALCVFFFASSALGNQPIPIAISNPGFETDPVSAGCFEVMPLTDWAVFDPNGIVNGGGNSVGALNLPPGSIFFPAGAPEGDHAALIFLLDSVGAGPVGLTQILGDSLEANTTYTLSVQVGNIESGLGPPPCDIFGVFNLAGFPGYHVQLLAGGEMIAEDNNLLAGAIPDGEFRLSSTTVCIPDTHPQLTELPEDSLLEIRLINLNIAETPEDPGIEVDFDDVQLVAQPNTAILIGNFDSDCDVDLDDYNDFAQCAGGPNQLPLAGCPIGVDADFDNDGDVDLEDYSMLSSSFTGAM